MGFYKMCWQRPLIYKQYWKCGIIEDMITNNNTEDMSTNMKTGQFRGLAEVRGRIYLSVCCRQWGEDWLLC